MMSFVQNLIARGYLIEAEVLKNETIKVISDIDDTLLTSLILNLNPPKVITKNFLESSIPLFLDKLKPISGEKSDKIKEYLTNICLPQQKVSKSPEFFLSRKVSILEEHNTKAKKIHVEDFIQYFRGRYQFFKSILQDRHLEGLTSIGKIVGNRREISIIGIVYSKRHTKNKNLLIELEDPTGKIAVVFNKDKEELFEKAESIVLDEVIAIKGSGNPEIIFANDVVFPDSGLGELKRAQEDEYAVFTADLHLGSDKFLEPNFIKFISWLNGDVGDETQKELSKKIKYLFIVGDLVDSIGVYPGQEKELKIKDVYEQYRHFAELIEKIRKDITIIICPGNHDAVRLLEPQPKFNPEMASDLYKLENVIITTNPSLVNIGKTEIFQGFGVLMYHGFSLDTFMDEVDSLRKANAKLNPELVNKFLLKKRHLGPTHACTLILPEVDDFLTIRTIPDILVTGHIHRSGILNYNGIVSISCSCWQSKTDYQEKLGHEPDPCKVCLFNLKTRKINVIDFS
jgi:DNA polymerase II small subunit